MLTIRSIVGGVIAVLAGASAAVAQDGPSLRDALLSKRAPAEAAVRYVTEDGSGGFVLDRSGEPPLLRLKGGAEVFALSQVSGPSGSVIFKTDAGAELVRVGDYGSVTYYPPDQPGGVPALLDGAAPLIEPAAGGGEALSLALGYLDVQLTTAFLHDVSIDPPPAGQAPSAFADAVRVTADAMTGDTQIAGGAEALARISFATGEASDASFVSGRLTVTVAPELGYAGRPSSERIKAVLAAG